MAPAPTSLYQHIYLLVRQIPPGKVSTYGRIAKSCGTTARTIGFAMAALPRGSDVPWQRVINSQGRISSRNDGEGNILQRNILELEGVEFSRQGNVNFERFLWEFPEQSHRSLIDTGQTGKQ